jgi:hypothetical protein
MTQADSVHSTPPTNTSVDPLYLPIDMTPWAYPTVDGEQDDCDREDDDPRELKLQPAVM